MSESNTTRQTEFGIRTLAARSLSRPHPTCCVGDLNDTRHCIVMPYACYKVPLEAARVSESVSRNYSWVLFDRYAPEEDDILVALLAGQKTSQGEFHQHYGHPMG